MFVVFELVVDATFAEDVEDDGVDLVYGFAAERAETVDVDTAVVERGDDGQVVVASEFEVFGTGAGCDVDDAGTFFVAYIFPFDDAVLVAGFGLCFEIVEGAAVSPSDEVVPLACSRISCLPFRTWSRLALSQRMWLSPSP